MLPSGRVFVSDSKIEIKVGSIVFSGEGDGDWLATQLDKVLAKIPELVATATPSGELGNNGNGNQTPSDPAKSGQSLGTLAAYLRSTNSTPNQVRKFLATS